MNTSEVEALFARTLVGHYDDDGAWAAIGARGKMATGRSSTTPRHGACLTIR
jgi:hypothetical protein